MLGLFKLEPYHDSELGDFERSHGHWRSRIGLEPAGIFRLSLVGDRRAPHSQALQLSRELRERFPSLVPEIQHGLFEHYLPYKEAVEEGIEMGGSFPQMADSVEVWSHVKPAHVLIETLNGGGELRSHLQLTGTSNTRSQRSTLIGISSNSTAACEEFRGL